MTAPRPHRRRPSARPEDAIQRGIVSYLRTVLPPSHRCFAIPNGGGRSKVEAGILKSTGTLAGVFDLCILGPGGATWWIEVKTEKGDLSDAQKEFQFFCIARGVPHAVCRSIDEVREKLRAWGLPTRDAAARPAPPALLDPKIADAALRAMAPPSSYMGSSA